MPPNKKHATVNAGTKLNDGIIENGIEKLDGFGIESDGDVYDVNKEMALSEGANDMSKLDEIDE